jgi:hypothetical protein
VPDTEFRFQPAGIADLLEALTGAELNEWDVAVPSGDGGSQTLGEISVMRQRRSMRRQDPPGVLVVSGNKRRVGSRGVEKAGLTDEQVQAAIVAAKSDADEKARQAGEPPPERVNVADRFFRAVRTRPLLLLHVIQGEPEKDSNTVLPDLEDAALVAIGLSFPTLENEPAAKEVKYKINLVKARELFASAIDPGDDDDTSDEEP